MFWSLFTTIYHTEPVLVTAEWVRLLCNTTKTLTGSSEEENRANNAIRAELFAGLYRFVLSTLATSHPTDLNLAYEVEGVLTEYMIDALDKCSYEYYTDWAEAIHSALAKTMHLSVVFSQSKLKKYILDGFTSVVMSNTNTTNTTNNSTTIAVEGSSSSGTGADDGFAKLDSKLLLCEAMLNAEASTSVYVHSLLTPTTTSTDTANSSKSTTTNGTNSSTYVSEIGLYVIETLNTVATTTNSDGLLMPYRSTRIRLGWILTQLLLHNALPQASEALAAVWTKLNSYGTSLQSPLPVPGSATGEGESMSVVAVSDADNKIISTTTTATTSGAGDVKANTASQHAIEIASNCIQASLYIVSHWRDEHMILALFPLLLLGSGHPDIDTAKVSHKACLTVLSSLKTYHNQTSSFSGQSFPAPVPVLSGLVHILLDTNKHTSFHVRETVGICATLLLAIHHYTLTPADRKCLKDVFAEGLVDSKPEVQAISKGGMVRTILVLLLILLYYSSKVYYSSIYNVYMVCATILD